MIKKTRILLIEPDRVLADIYKQYLEKANYKVKVTSGVQQAINEVDKNRPSLIILELQLSGHNGYEFLYELRSYSDLQDIPVLIHTMVPRQAANLGVKTDSLGIVGYLYKPETSLSKLAFELNNLLLVNAS